MHIVCIVVHCTTHILIFHINSINKVPITNGIGATWNAAWNVSVQVDIVLIIIAISFIILLRTGHFGMSAQINSKIILITNIIFPFRRLRRFRYFFGCDWKNNSFTLFLINITYIITTIKWGNVYVLSSVSLKVYSGVIGTNIVVWPQLFVHLSHCWKKSFSNFVFYLSLFNTCHLSNSTKQTDAPRLKTLSNNVPDLLDHPGLRHHLRRLLRRGQESQVTSDHTLHRIHTLLEAILRKLQLLNLLCNNTHTF